ncbi:class I SAM-dependent methyltransferase [Achromobacter sp. DMS1]|uniref:class I SAM-dependent methyltransferase n=1 Tax=Achromobacter sp. DMS1 TaxID=1688405 RepID=UPI00069F0F25|nr:class I SAM-dependent methyltransferase [Achromobacter sp. DMS1]
MLAIFQFYFSAIVLMLPLLSCVGIGAFWARRDLPFGGSFITTLVTSVTTPALVFHLARTRAFQDLAQAYLAREPAGCLVNLGCGLSDYFQWLDNGQARMVDADLPEVIALRREWLGQPGPRRTLAELDLCQPGWWDRLGLPSGPGQAPVFLMSEGVLMYLQPQAVSAILAEVGERAPAGSVFAFDAMCWLAAGRARRHPSVRHTRAEFGWGPRRLADLTTPAAAPAHGRGPQGHGRLWVSLFRLRAAVPPGLRRAFLCRV